MLIGGLEKLSLIDYPGKLSAIVFTLGCNFQCHYCYNPMLVKPSEADKIKHKTGSGERTETGRVLIKERDLFEFLDRRKGKLDGVVITGGEPSIHKDLPDFLKRIKKRGFLVKLDTNGTNPEALNKLLKKELVDYLAMDLKADEANYSYVTGVSVDVDKIKESVKIIMESGLSYEFRTTLVPELVGKDNLDSMGEMIKGASRWYLQKFIPAGELVDPKFKKITPYTEAEMEEMKKTAEKYVKFCGLRS